MRPSARGRYGRCYNHHSFVASPIELGDYTRVRALDPGVYSCPIKIMKWPIRRAELTITTRRRIVVDEQKDCSDAATEIDRCIAGSVSGSLSCIQRRFRDNRRWRLLHVVLFLLQIVWLSVCYTTV